MTPKEKALELRDKYYDEVYAVEDDTIQGSVYRFSVAKDCALIAVEELIESDPSTDYWKYVKTELNKL